MNFHFIIIQVVHIFFLQDTGSPSLISTEKRTKHFPDPIRNPLGYLSALSKQAKETHQSLDVVAKQVNQEPKDDTGETSNILTSRSSYMKMPSVVTLTNNSQGKKIDPEESFNISYEDKMIENKDNHQRNAKENVDILVDISEENSAKCDNITQETKEIPFEK